MECTVCDCHKTKGSDKDIYCICCCCCCTGECTLYGIEDDKDGD